MEEGIAIPTWERETALIMALCLEWIPDWRKKVEQDRPGAFFLRICSMALEFCIEVKQD